MSTSRRNIEKWDFAVANGTVGKRAEGLSNRERRKKQKKSELKPPLYQKDPTSMRTYPTTYRRHPPHVNKMLKRAGFGSKYWDCGHGNKGSFPFCECCLEKYNETGKVEFEFPKDPNCTCHLYDENYVTAEMVNTYDSDGNKTRSLQIIVGDYPPKITRHDNPGYLKRLRRKPEAEAESDLVLIW